MTSLDALVRQRTAQRAAVQDHEARLKAVAGILLNRGNSAGRCGRRLPPNRGPRTYRRSRLSTDDKRRRPMRLVSTLTWSVAITLTGRAQMPLLCMCTSLTLILEWDERYSISNHCLFP
ncbi:hypothetical protein EDC04DRAFT_2583603 [Pisolithus marmoratus]|nr:hypothetical protein EDC04DRAFT_2583603 [Pisolithus marmoratus]